MIARKLGKAYRHGSRAKTVEVLGPEIARSKSKRSPALCLLARNVIFKGAIFLYLGYTIFGFVIITSMLHQTITRDRQKQGVEKCGFDFFLQGVGAANFEIAQRDVMSKRAGAASSTLT